MIPLLFALCSVGCREVEAEPEVKLMVFLSTSVPFPTWEAYAAEQKGIFLIRGVPDSSPLLLLKKLKNLRVPVDIDPDAFDRYQVEEVPTIILKKGGQFDKVIGNVPIGTALRLMAEQGDLHEEAKTLLP
jgi:type-F conjugative transfer system pilin assembly protein TrbC